jgi:hypothetical protein
MLNVPGVVMFAVKEDCQRELLPMLKFNPARKNKIDLSNYEYHRDIENRLFMSSLSTFDVEVLEEVVHSSLTLDIASLATALEADAAEIIAVVDRLSETGLLRREGQKIFVDKETRKYYESQIDKFDDNFRPNLHFLQGLLSKVPIHVLPSWYSIPRSSTNIFESLIEKYLLTPRTFQRYLLELNLGDPIIQGILDDVYQAPDFKIRSRDLRQKYGLSREVFEEYMLHLELNFLCCLSYNQIDDQWKEVVTPFHEWRQHLRFVRDTMPELIADEASIALTHPQPLGFAQDIKTVLEKLQHRQIQVEAAEAPLHWKVVQQAPLEATPDYLSWLIYKLVGLELCEVQGDKLVKTERGIEWEAMSLEELALALYRHPQNPWRDAALQQSPRLEREFREVERSLQRVASLGWVSFDTFIKGVMAAVRGAPEVSLQKVGRRWAYTRPTYTPDQVNFIYQMIFERFFEAGFVTIGTYQDKACFAVTPFGRSMLSLDNSL